MDIDTTRKSKAFNSAKVTAHTAIIPTVSVPDVNALSTDERNVYLAIAQHYLVQFMPEKAYQEVSVAIQCGDESFYARARKTTDSGFEAFLVWKMPGTMKQKSKMMIPLLIFSVKFAQEKQ